MQGLALTAMPDPKVRVPAELAARFGVGDSAVIFGYVVDTWPSTGDGAPSGIGRGVDMKRCLARRNVRPGPRTI